MNGPRTLLFALVIVAVVFILGGVYLCQSSIPPEVKLEVDQRKQEANELFIASLINRPDLVGRIISDFPEITANRDREYEAGHKMLAIWLKLKLLTPATKNIPASDKPASNDKAYYFQARTTPPREEGTYRSGTIVYVRDGKILGVFEEWIAILP